MLCRGVMEATERLEAPFAVRVGGLEAGFPYNKYKSV